MARPTKQGVDYFPLDCHFNDKIELYIVETGAEGLAVLITLWQLIYSNHGYYIEHSNDLPLLIKRRISIDLDQIKVCLRAALKRQLFDERLYDRFGIWTSRAIQKRYFDAAKRKKSIEFCEKYVINGVNVGDNSINVDINDTKGKGEVEEEVEGEEKEYIPPIGGIHESSGEDPPEPARVPIKKIVDLWNDFAQKHGLHLTVKVTETLKGQIRQRWREDLPGLDRFSNYFEFLNESDFLMGRATPRPGEKPFRASLLWVTKAGNFAKIAAREYHD